MITASSIVCVGIRDILPSSIANAKIPALIQSGVVLQKPDLHIGVLLEVPRKVNIGSLRLRTRYNINQDLSAGEQVHPLEVKGIVDNIAKPLEQ